MSETPWWSVTVWFSGRTALLSRSERLRRAVLPETTGVTQIKNDQETGSFRVLFRLEPK
jgi:hypothetical protein